MALEHIQYAYDYDGPASTAAALMLHVLAHKMGANAYCWPSYEYLGKKIRKTSRTARAACDELAAAGVLHIDSGKSRGGANRFRILSPREYHLYFLHSHDARQADQHWEENQKYIVDNSQLINKVGSPLPTPLDTSLPTEVGNPRQRVGRNCAEGRKPTSHKQEKITNQPQQAMLLPPDIPDENRDLPPVDSMRFKSIVLDFCYELGAPHEVCERIYERNKALDWVILKHKTLKYALTRAVEHWRDENKAAFESEKIRRYLESHPNI